MDEKNNVPGTLEIGKGAPAPVPAPTEDVKVGE